VVNHGWAPPGASINTGPNTTINHGNTTINGSRTYEGRGDYGWYDSRNRTAGVGGLEAFHGRGDYGWHHFRPLYGWGANYFSYSYSPYYGSSGYGDSSCPSGSTSDGGGTGPSSQSGPSVAVPGDDGAANADKETAAAERCMESALRAFRTGDYAEAQRQCEQAIRLLPGDANLNGFRALCQFAQGNYKDADATLRRVLAAGWDWDTLSSFYPNAQTYTKQLRALEQYVKENPKDAAGHFVLAYHYLVLDERDAALEQLHEVDKLRPRDKPGPGR
jgi:tetratricopeptide (TPR) repeat protein